MKLGAAIEAGRGLGEAVARARLAEDLGYDSVWSSQLPTARDTMLLLAAFAQATQRVRLGTAVLPIYQRHPSQMAQAALTLDELSGGRFILGIGVSHRVTVEGMWGLRLEHPTTAMREYLQAVRDIISTGSSSAEGHYFTARSAYLAPRRPELPIIVAALGDRMLEMAGELADGVALWMCSPGYVRDHVIPRVRAGRERAGRTLEGFEVVAAVPVALTDSPDEARAAFRKTVERYASLPFYRSMMEASGFADELGRGEVSDAMLDELGGIGDPSAIRKILDRYREAGVTLASVGPLPKSAGTAGVEATLEATIA